MICPITGLSITESKNWTNIIISKNYKVTFKLIGSNILQHLAVGDMREFDTEKYYTARRKVIEEAFPDNKKYMEIKDYGMLSNAPNQFQRKKQLQYFLSEHHKNCLAYCMYNAPFIIRNLLRFGLTIAPSKPFPVKVFEDYASTMQFILNLDNLKVQAGHLSKDDFFTKLNWKVTEKNGNAQIKVAKGEYLFIQYQGEVKEPLTVKKICDVQEEIFGEGYITIEKYVRIADYSKVFDFNFKLRKKYAHNLSQLEKKYGFKCNTAYIIGASSFVKAALTLVQNVIDMKYYYVNSFAEALDKINQKHLKNKLKYYRISETDFDKLIKIIGGIVWEQKDDNFEYFPEQHPFNDVLAAYKLVKDDFMLMVEQINQTNLELQSAKSNEEAANALKSQFLNNISHEIRTPLNGIIGMVSILEYTPLNDEQKKHVNLIVRNSNQLLNIVSDLLEYSKIEAQKLELEISKTNLRNIISQVVEGLSFQAKEKGLEIITYIDDKIPQFVQADQVKLKQVLNNLISNSLKFTFQGEITVSAHLFEEVGNFIRVKFEVQDTGIGISEDFKLNLFKPFEQQDGSSTREFGGIGLGLSIAKHLITIMGGNIWVESELDKGSLFGFILDFKTNIYKKKS